ncbi:MAG: hypothetical protein V4650_07075 [Pseudomonadota bacterium]
MALILNCPNTNQISVEEYLNHIESKVDLRDPDSVIASAHMLRALANDRNLVVSRLNAYVEEAFGASGLASAQVILLGRRKDFYVRANLWPSAADVGAGRMYQDQFSYNIAHDHNFSFLTVGYLGPGYETDIYEYDYDKVEGYVGEKVDIRFLEKVRFAANMAMYYRPSRDLHIQYPPSEMTITLNLMIVPPEIRLREQYEFDLATKTISRLPSELEASRRVAFVMLSARLGDGNTAQLLEDLAQQHPCRRTRLTAWQSLSVLRPDEAQRFWEKASADSAPLVANHARRRLETGRLVFSEANTLRQ